MSLSESSTGQPAVSLAEAKLARQNKRIEQADAALIPPPPPERDRPAPRAKGKKTVWKPFDITADTTAATQVGEVSMPATEVRISTFRAPVTRDNSLGRTMSSLSQRTTATISSDVERQDRPAIDTGGFQLYNGRKNRKVVDQLNAHEERPEQKQTTVEATVDTREIYEVFGNALPGIDYLEENPGSKDGQLQFVQHPNGDVAAHQWSNERFLWDNIGQYSNIRKKIQGQLASDRLKGETAYQTLQQNTLAYFRTVAKQREATAMGLPFGTKDAQAAIPDLRATAQPAPTVFVRAFDAAESTKAFVPGVDQALVGSQRTQEMNSRSQARVPTVTQPNLYEAQPGYYNSSAYPGYRGDYSSITGHPHARSLHPPTAHPSHCYNNHLFQSTAPPNVQDPFYIQQSYRNVYGSPPGTFGVYPAGALGYGSSIGYGDKTPSLSYDYDLPPGSADRTYAALLDRRDSADLRAHPSPRGPVDQGVPTMSPRQRGEGYVAERGAWPSVSTGAETSSSSTLAAPLSVRNSMRHQLFKISDQAKERSLSQANIRTVLHDPFSPRTGGTTDTAGASDVPAMQDPFPELKKTVANPSGLPPSAHATGAQHAASARVLAPTFGAYRSTPGASTENSVMYSSPGPSWSKKDTVSTPYAISKSERRDDVTTDKAMGETLEDMLSYFESKAKAKDEEARNRGKQSGDQKLNEWWMNGSTFARHEDMYNAIKAANTSYMTSSPPDTFGPNVTPAEKATNVRPAEHASPGVNKHDAHTRLLVPVLENLASYVQGPEEKRRDYFSRWIQPPEWAIDRNHNTSFYDKEPWEPPARVGRDPRYRSMPAEGGTPGSHGGGQEPGASRYAGVENLRFGAFGSPTASAGSSLVVGAGLERRSADMIGKVSGDDKYHCGR
ncbi:hypothetical protein LTS02_016231 [Friedmanniomyces endolithicus]|nr:hypothetical protein LTR94_001384 [Friedmanniomyces endolithicus]KAK0775405.1 hypothetical protein LTR75_016592 [Friedmanniomyces endolithicus]KAK0784769.1 hypothetical protein LTR38_012542 [Friedmanniomyces endolithicus]KAK0800483.1 hypothetical protein LTR59_005752 [Friedmanniomyces endolithicus]KAK0843119.1 hypothetical protein LTS02_016231 [Friedmanniomyces endolithicus]